MHVCDLEGGLRIAEVRLGLSRHRQPRGLVDRDQPVPADRDVAVHAHPPTLDPLGDVRGTSEIRGVADRRIRVHLGERGVQAGGEARVIAAVWVFVPRIGRPGRPADGEAAAAELARAGALLVPALVVAHDAVERRRRLLWPVPAGGGLSRLSRQTVAGGAHRELGRLHLPGDLSLAGVVTQVHLDLVDDVETHGLGAVGRGRHAGEHVRGGRGAAAAQGRQDGEGEHGRRGSHGCGGDKPAGGEAAATVRMGGSGRAGCLQPGLELLVEARPQGRRVHMRVEQSGEPRVPLVIVRRAHRDSPSPDSSGRNTLRMAARASESRDATVPTGTSSAWATEP